MYITASNFLQVAFLTVLVMGLLLIWGKPRYLALRLYLASASVLMVLNFIEETRVSPYNYIITPSFSLLEGPLFYLVIAQLVYADFKLTRKSLLHLAPACCSLLFNFWPQWVLAAGTVSQIVYFSTCIQLTRRFNFAAKLSRSDAFDLRLGWVKNLLWVMLTIALIDALRHNLQPYLPLQTLQIWYFAMQLCYLLIAALIIIRAVRTPLLFEGLSQAEYSLATQQPHEENQAETLFNELNSRVKNEHLYRTPRLSVRDLANTTGLLERDISWAINKGANLNFNDYINALRLDEVAERLAQPQQHKSTPPLLLDIAFAAGFNSKTSFNTLFKQRFGVTPSQYQKG